MLIIFPVTPPNAPSGVSVSNIQSQSVLVSWNDQSDADTFIVVYNKTVGSEQFGLCKPEMESGSIITDDSSINLSLRAYTTYSIHVIAMSGASGFSSQSNPRAFTTLQRGDSENTFPPKIKLIFPFTGASVPPQDVRITVQSSTAILVTWNGLSPCTEVNGNIVEYSVTYQTLPSGTMESVIVPGVWNMDGQRVTLNGLNPFTTYSIQVAAVNEEGDVGVFSEPVTGQTNENSETRLRLVLLFCTCFFLSFFYSSWSSHRLIIFNLIQNHSYLGPTTEL